MPAINGWTCQYDELVDRDQGLGQLFHQRMLEDPAAAAIVDGDDSLTYEDLHFQAAHLAQKIAESDFTTEEPVGIVVQHGIWDAVTQVAIIYAGGSCVTLDPNLPDLQIQDRLQSLNARSILVDAHNSKRDLPFRSIVVNDIVAVPANKIEPSTSGQYPVATRLGHRTHLIHTSGTTSKPKAVQIIAKSIVHVANYAPFEPVRKTDVIAHGNSTSFDVALFDIWVPLIQGARIAVLSKLVLIDPPAFAAAVERYGITAMTITAPLVNLIASVCPRAFAPFRVVLMGGEAVNVTAMEIILKAGPPENMINAYGPTECCMFCLAHRITLKDVENGHVSIGHPIGQNVATLCDELGRPVAEGVQEGELVVGGPGVSPGYVGLPEKNAAAFLELPGLSDPSGQPYHMYRTGDFVKQCLDGQYDFLGRQDEQVKVRGYRIELSAVETALMRLGHFSEGVVLSVTSKDEVAGSVLVAFVVLKPSIDPTTVAHAVKDLQAVLPDYMVPHIEVVSKIPLNNHAKVDRKGLIEVYHHGRERKICKIHQPTIEGGDSTRGQLARLWEGILGISAASYLDDDDFFLLGGTSLQASLLITQIRHSFDTQMSLLTLYDNSTLSQLSMVLDANRGSTMETIHDQRDIWVADTKIADHLSAPVGPVIDWQRDTEGRVFMTGATGFVGAFFLADLLENSAVRQVGCLIRASDRVAGLQRLQHVLEKYGLWRDEHRYKLLPLCGKLEDEYLGMGERRFKEIADWASVVFHFGARVNYTQPYSYHRPANIVGTVNVIRLACTGRSKGVHYSSSISAFGPTGFATGSSVIYENEPLMNHLDAILYDHGYAQSQWVADQLLQRLIHRGFPIAVYRPGFITGHAKTGACNPDDFFSRLIRACSDIKCYPALPNQRKEFVTVDYICSSMLHIASSVFSVGRSFHLLPPTRAESVDLDRAMELISVARGSHIQQVEYSEWIRRLSESAHPSLQPLLPMLAEKVHEERSRWELYEGMPMYDTTNTLRATANYPGGLEFPVLDDIMMGKYLDYLQG